MRPSDQSRHSHTSRRRFVETEVDVEDELEHEVADSELSDSSADAMSSTGCASAPVAAGATPLKQFLHFSSMSVSGGITLPQETKCL